MRDRMVRLSRRSLILSGVAGAAFPAAALAGDRKVSVAKSGLDLASRDLAVRPGDDFFRYANGGWLKNVSIPPDEANWNEWTRLAALNARRTKEILEQCAHGSWSRDPDAAKLGDLYASLMDADLGEKQGFRPLEAILDRIRSIRTPAELAAALASLSRDWLRSPFTIMQVSPITVGNYLDLKSPDRYLPALQQGGLGVPDRDYLLGEKPAQVKVQQVYREHLTRLFRLAGQQEMELRADRVIGLEASLAQSQRTRVELRDLRKRYNVWSREDFASKAPGLDWTVFLDTAGLRSKREFLVADPEAIAGAAALAASASLDAWRDYLVSRSIMMFALAGPGALVSERFAFQEKVLAGTAEEPSREKRVAGLVDLAMGSAVGAIYLERYYPSTAQAAARSVASNLKAAMAVRIGRVSWMSQPTKTRALTKLSALRIETGGETTRRDYSNLKIDRRTPYLNLLNAARHDYEHKLTQLDNPVDRGAWDMLPQTVNAQANPMLGKIMFPAGVMQGRLFNPDADSAVNYGAFGAIAGHELSHHFDDQGSMFDERGALANWWRPEDYERFKAATGRLVSQYDNYQPLPGIHIIGALTLGENIADLAGLNLALDAYHQSLGGRDAPIIDGLTGDQRLFLSFAQVWRELNRLESLQRQLATSGHAPGEWRVAEVRNVDAWYEAFEVKPGDAQYLAPEDRVRIW